MDNFIDTTNIEGRFEFSEFVRAYGKYLDEQLEVFSAVQWYQVDLMQDSSQILERLAPHICQHLPVFSVHRGSREHSKLVGLAAIDLAHITVVREPNRSVPQLQQGSTYA